MRTDQTDCHDMLNVEYCCAVQIQKTQVPPPSNQQIELKQCCQAASLPCRHCTGCKRPLVHWLQAPTGWHDSTYKHLLLRGMHWSRLLASALPCITMSCKRHLVSNSDMSCFPILILALLLFVFAYTSRGSRPTCSAHCNGSAVVSAGHGMKPAAGAG